MVRDNPFRTHIMAASNLDAEHVEECLMASCLRVLASESFESEQEEYAGSSMGAPTILRLAPTCRCFGSRREEGQRGTVGVDKTGDMRRRARAWRADCIDYQGSRRVRDHGEEVRRDGRPLARAPEEETAGERCARTLLGDDRPPARRRLQELAQAEPHSNPGQRETARRGRLPQ